MRFTVLVVLACLCAFVAAPSASDLQSTPVWKPVGRYDHEPIRESSGISASYHHPDVFWTLNDSGNEAVLYATRPDGELISEVAVEGAENYDWEGMFVDESGIWIGEIGNNSTKRTDLRLYLVPEPNPYQDSVVAVAADYPYTYPDKNVDAEGLFLLDGVPHIVSKERRRADLYRFPELKSGQDHVLERVGELTDAEFVTGASVTPDGRRLVVTSYQRVWVYHTESPSNDLKALISARPWTLAHRYYPEAVTLIGNDLLFTSEDRSIYRLPAWWYEHELRMPPPDINPAADFLATASVDGGSMAVQTYVGAGVEIPGTHLLVSGEEPGTSFSQTLHFPWTDRYGFTLVHTEGPHFGHAELSVDGRPVGIVEGNSNRLLPCTITDVGSVAVSAGDHSLSLKVLGPGADGQFRFGLDSYDYQSVAPFASEYLVLGAFTKTDPDNIDTPYAPETDLNLDGRFEIEDGREIAWRKATMEADGRLIFWRYFAEDASRPVVAYALTHAWSDREKEAVLLLAADDQVAVWLNGEEVYRLNKIRGTVGEAIPVTLQAGWNRVLCKVGQNFGGWVLSLRFTDPDGTVRYESRPSVGSGR